MSGMIPVKQVKYCEIQGKLAGINQIIASNFV